MKSLLIPLLFLSSVCQAQSFAWHKITSTADGIDVFAEKHYVKNVGDNVRQTMVSMSQSTNLIIFLVDCSTGEIAHAKTITEKYNLKSNNTFSRPTQGSVGEKIRDWTCK